MRRKFVPCFAPILVALLASTASAEPIRYSTMPDDWGGGYSASGRVRFEGTSGTIVPGSDLAMGRFVIDPPNNAAPASLDGEEFWITTRTPDFDRIVPAGPTTNPLYDTKSYSSMVIGGHFTVEGQTITAVFDSAKVGAFMPVPAAWTPPPNFPVAMADVKLPASVVFKPYLNAVGIGYSADVSVQITPEPATLVAWSLVGVGAIMARRRTRTSAC